MLYETSVTVGFDCDREAVFEALTYLGRYPEWNQGMIFISHTGPMMPGLKFQTRTRVLGSINAADVQVVNLVPPELVHLKSDSGIIGFNAVFRLKDKEGGRSEVSCALEFRFHNAVMSLARGVIESMAKDRLRADLERLAALLREDGRE